MGNVLKIHDTSFRVQLRCGVQGWTAEQFIEEYMKQDTEVSREAVRAWYYRNKLPRRPERLATLCDVLDCDIDYLLGRIDESTHDRSFIRRETGLGEDAIKVLQEASEVETGGLWKVNLKPLAAAVNYLLTNAHGMSLLEHIYDYINSGTLSLAYQGQPVKEDITLSNSHTHSTYSISPDEYDAILLTQIQRDLVLLKEVSEK